MQPACLFFFCRIMEFKAYRNAITLPAPILKAFRFLRVRLPVIGILMGLVLPAVASRF